MKLNKYIFILLLIFFISGCSKTIENVGTINVGYVGNVEKFDYDNVKYESINMEDLLLGDDLREKYSFIMIDDDYFNTVSELKYVERFEDLKMPIVFVDSTKGHLPFMRETTQKNVKKMVYDEYNEVDKSTVVLKYPLPAIAEGLFYNYKKDQDTLSEDDFEYIVTYIYENQIVYSN